MSRAHWPGAALGLPLLLAVAVVGPARAVDFNAGASVSPAFVHIGESASYTAFVVVPRASGVVPRWLPPDSSRALTWGPLRASRRGNPQGSADTLFLAAALQAFQLGNVVIPGMAFIDQARAGAPPMRLPAVRLTVIPVIPASDSAADLKPVRGPLKAPWWEVVPWLLVVAIALAAGVLAAWIVRLRRRPGRAAPVMATSDAGATALARLAELRARRLPEAGDFGTHALELTAILRRFLEATTVRLRPGFTTAEMTGRLREESVPAHEAATLLNLLRAWDRVKFARAPYTLDEARGSEDAVEQFVRRHQRPGNQEAA